jgi:hypothetical protein
MVWARTFDTTVAALDASLDRLGLELSGQVYCRRPVVGFPDPSMSDCRRHDRLQSSANELLIVGDAHAVVWSEAALEGCGGPC